MSDSGADTKDDQIRQFGDFADQGKDSSARLRSQINAAMTAKKSEFAYFAAIYEAQQQGLIANTPEFEEAVKESLARFSGGQ
jgi:hypothetical protein